MAFIMASQADQDGTSISAQAVIEVSSFPCTILWEALNFPSINQDHAMSHSHCSRWKNSIYSYMKETREDVGNTGDHHVLESKSLFLVNSNCTFLLFYAILNIVSARERDCDYTMSRVCFN